MDGDSAPLAAIHAAAQAAGALLLVDDAHGVGVVGDEGRGSCAAQAVRPELLVVTFGKAFGVSGAAVLCSAPSPSTVAATAASTWRRAEREDGWKVLRFMLSPGLVS